MSQIESAFQHPPDNLQNVEWPSQAGVLKWIEQMGGKQEQVLNSKGVKD